MVRCTWDRFASQAAEQTAHPSAVRAGGRILSSNGCTQIDEEPENDASAPVLLKGVKRISSGASAGTGAAGDVRPAQAP